MEGRNIALLGALLFICRPAASFVSVVGPVTAGKGAGVGSPRGVSAPWNEHGRGPVSSLAGRRSRAGGLGALSMAAKTVRSAAAIGSPSVKAQALLDVWLMCVRAVCVCAVCARPTET